MSKKSYLSSQIKLMSLLTSDFFTDEEYDLYVKIINCVNTLSEIKNNSETQDPTIRLSIIESRNELQRQLDDLIISHTGTPRTLRIASVVDTRFFKDETGNVYLPDGITWYTLKPSRRVAEFSSAGSRMLGLNDGDITFDKIIIKWKSLDILRQLVLDGFNVPILTDSGDVLLDHYRVLTASAGQLRTDKIQCISDSAWERIHNTLECGLTWDVINSKGGVNVNKYSAYIALPFSATDEWDISIDDCLVIKDFEAPVTGLMQYINKEYKSSREIKEVIIPHSDGCGMMLPEVSRKNFMCRGPWIKGLLASFDYIKFCKVNNCEPIIEDVWGKLHDLAKENIKILFTASQLKMWKYYDSWDEYKYHFKKNRCSLNKTNYEEDYISDTDICYQMLQTLTDFTDEEIFQFTRKAHDRINSIGQDMNSMLKALRADENSDESFNKALALYNPLLRDGYSKDMLRAIKKKWLLDAKSGKIKCSNKRLFAIPDLYAACQFWFLNQERPEGLLKDGEVSCKIFRHKEKIACLRSPHLYMEWAIRKVVKDRNIYEWFYTNGIYTSCHDLISRILQFDVDGKLIAV